MKKIAALAAGVSTALSGISYGAGFEDATASLYYQLPFGGTQSQSLSSYGFAVDYDVSAGTFGNTNPLRRSLVDFRFQQNQLQEMKLNGVSLAVRDQNTNDLTIGGKEISNVTAAVVGGLLVAGILCVTENVICEDDDDRDDDNPPPPPE
jgi:hypothetical protein